MRPLVLLLLALSGLLAVSFAAPTCQLTNLELVNADNGAPLKFHDSDGNGFSPDNDFYLCNCENTISTVKVRVKANTAVETGVSYKLRFKNGLNVISNMYLTPSAWSSRLKFEPTFNKLDVIVRGAECSEQYTVYCSQIPDDGSNVVGDPQFAGLRGQDYQVHGVSGEVYNIITDADLQLNSKFVFLDSGRCPTFAGRKAHGCWSHPGSYLGEIGLKTAGGDRLKIVSGDYQTGFAAVELNGAPMEEGATVPLACAGCFVTFNHSFVLTVQAGNFHMQFENSDYFLNQRVRVLDWSRLSSHGLLGQTWRTATYKNPIKYVEGDVDSYVVAGKDLFGDSFDFNRFQQQPVQDELPQQPSESELQMNQMMGAGSDPDAQQGFAPMPAIDAQQQQEIAVDSSAPAEQPAKKPSLLELMLEMVKPRAASFGSAVEAVAEQAQQLVAEIRDQEQQQASEQQQNEQQQPVEVVIDAQPTLAVEMAAASEEPATLTVQGPYELVAEIKEGAYEPDPIGSTRATQGQAAAPAAPAVEFDMPQQPAAEPAMQIEVMPTEAAEVAEVAVLPMPAIAVEVASEETAMAPPPSLPVEPAMPAPPVAEEAPSAAVVDPIAEPQPHRRHGRRHPRRHPRSGPRQMLQEAAN